MAFISSWRSSRNFLHRMLLGVDVFDVCCRYGKRGMDDGTGLHDGNRKEHALGSENQRPAGRSPAGMGRIDRGKSRLYLAVAVNLIFVATAHDGHTHSLGNIPIWQIVLTVGLAVGIYVGLRLWKKWRSRRSK